ncbi:E3 ubiquitin-protein ligase TRIM39-like isoform X2 [Ambystoma mexicanum]|uniref:E3 ubiquitin-protein ligase TRIM39-like isoform X2 n=1 Tax=Ambystoma mexicanum TaxID=8296 RepID=UPI0037E82447
MAARGEFQDLKEEATCSICLEFFKDPVTIDCGHNFCRSCITQCWEGSEVKCLCPQCRENSPGRSLRPNRQLGNIVEMVKRINLPTAVKSPAKALCVKHEEKLKLFCEEDQEIICLVCRESTLHKTHCVSPIEEAAQGCKVKFHGQRENIICVFEDLKQFLEKELQSLLSNLEKEQEENMKKIRGKVTELDKQQQSHRNLIVLIEGKFQQQDVDLLKGAQTVLNRSEIMKVSKLSNDYAIMEKSLQYFSCQHAYLKESFMEFKEKMTAELEFRGLKSFKIAVTLDPGTAHPKLILSQDRRDVQFTDRVLLRLDTPGRFTYYPCVLGSEGFTSGRHYWEVQLLQDGKGWDVGVVKESVNRKGKLDWSLNGGLWGMDWYFEAYGAFTFPRTPLFPIERPRKVGVFLDYEGGRLSLYNADTAEHLFTFTNACFREKMFPFFHFWPGAEMSMV